MRLADLLPVGLALTLGGCVLDRSYLAQRKNDLLDCVSLHAGYGIGLSVRIGVSQWISSGVGYSGARCWGFEGRRFGEFERFHAGMPLSLGRPLFFQAIEASFRSAMKPIGIPEERWRDWPGCLYLVTDESELNSADTSAARTVIAKRTASILVFDVLSSCKLRECWEWAQGFSSATRDPIDAMDFAADVTLMPVSTRLRISPGQFADFLLGWAGFDLGRDDSNGSSYFGPATCGCVRVLGERQSTGME